MPLAVLTGVQVSAALALVAGALGIIASERPQPTLPALETQP